MSNSLFPDFSVSMNREPLRSLTELESIPRALESKLSSIHLQTESSQGVPQKLPSPLLNGTYKATSADSSPHFQRDLARGKPANKLQRSKRPTSRGL